MALVFDAATKYLSITSDLPNYNAAYWWRARVRFNALTTFDTVFVISDGTANNRDILLLNTAAPAERIGIRVTVGGAQTTQIGSTVLSTGVWYDLDVVRESATSIRLYINGTLEVTNTRNVSDRASATAMRVAIDQSGSNNAVIDVAYMKMFTVSPAAGQLVNERRQIRLASHSNVYGWWPMLKGSQRNVDFSGNGRNWTENGTISDTAGPGLTWGADVSTVILPPDERFGTATIAAPDVTVSGTGTVDIDGTASAGAPAITVSSTGTVEITGTLTAAAPSVTVNATGVNDAEVVLVPTWAAERTYVVPADDRSYIVAQDDRIYVVAEDDRIYQVKV